MGFLLVCVRVRACVGMCVCVVRASVLGVLSVCVCLVCMCLLLSVLSVAIVCVCVVRVCVCCTGVLSVLIVCA